MSHHTAVDRYGHGEIEPAGEAICGEFGTWRLTFAVGFHGIDNGGSFGVTWRGISNWAAPQLDRPQEANYCTVRTEAKVKLVPSLTQYIRPWGRLLRIAVRDGSLAPGDKVVITYGDTSSGGPGIRAQTFAEETFEFRLLVDPFGTGEYLRVPEPPTIRLIGGPPAALKALVPSQVVVGEPFRLLVHAEDEWGNPSVGYQGAVQLSLEGGKCEGLPESYTFAPANGGVHCFEGLKLKAEGTFRFVVADEVSGLRTESNPLICAAERPAYRAYWADLHGQTEDSVGTGTVLEYFTYGRDVAGLDALAHAANDFQITESYYYDVAQRVQEFHEPGRFITFLAYEWSGLTPAGGDHNVYFLKDTQEIHRSGHALIPDKWDESTDRYPLSELCKTYRGRNDVIIVPHIGGRRANLDFFDPELMPAIEIYSCHGVFEWFLREALERGLVVGFCAGSDDHTCRPGATTGTSFGLGEYGGLTAILAPELTREALWEALKARRIYATTGERIWLDFRCGGHLMGEEFTSPGPYTFQVHIAGTDSLREVTIFRGLKPLYSYPVVDWSNVLPNTVEITWTGARTDSRDRHTTWDGELALEGGKILSARMFGHAGPEQGLARQDDTRVCWRSATAGNREGLLLELDAPPEAMLRFTTRPAKVSLRLGDIPNEGVTYDAGGLEQAVSFGRYPARRGPTNLAFSFTDCAPPQGLNAYYLRVRQFNGALAWSSPIYIHTP